jgi:tetratricopeptide (TPR) repeat protein
LAAKLDLPEKTDPDQGVIIKAVRSWLDQNKGWLLVFDNAQDFEDLEDYLPRAGSGHVVITSRNQSWGGVARMLPVDVFTPAESVEFLRTRTGQDDEDAARALADALGNLPLALEQAGAYIEETGTSLASYLNLFQERQKDLLGRGKPAAYPDTVATTWDLSFQKAREEVPVSADLLSLCAFLAPDDIPKSILAEGSDHLPEPLDSAVADEMVLNDAVAALRRYSLLNVADDALSVHRLVQAVTRDRLAKEQSKWAEVAVWLVYNAFPPNSYDVRTWPVCSLLLPHALAASEHAERLKVAPEATGRLLNNIGPYLNERAEYDGAKSVWERALKIFEKAFGPDHPNVARTVGNLGLVLRHLGDFEGAKKCNERALKIFEKAFGPDHPEVARAVGNLGLVLRDQGDLEGARENLERALEIFRECLGEDHPDTIKTRNNLKSLRR